MLAVEERYHAATCIQAQSTQLRKGGQGRIVGREWTEGFGQWDWAAMRLSVNAVSCVCLWAVVSTMSVLVAVFSDSVWQYLPVELALLDSLDHFCVRFRGQACRRCPRVLKVGHGAFLRSTRVQESDMVSH